MKKSLFILYLALICSAAYSQSDKTEILILGTPHLNQIEGFKSQMLDNLISELQKMEFDGICIESMTTELLHDIESRNDSAFAGVLETFGGNRLIMANRAQKEFGITFQQAEDEIDQILQKPTLSAEDREKLIQLFLCAGDIASAVLQYQYLDGEIDFNSNTEFNGGLNKELTSYSTYSNEIYSLAIPLAKVEGIQKIEYVDNFQDEAILLDQFPHFIDDYVANQELFSEIADKPVYLKSDSLQKGALEQKDFIEFYRYLNSNTYQQADYEAQWAIWLETNFESGSDLSRYALWEMRNLQIAANIMRVAAHYPRQRILVIIGASHKSFLEKYLELVPSIEVLSFG